MFPDFLCIGAQKAGTTWLHRNLSRHPDVWLPSVKEVHYFDYSVRFPSPLSRKYYNDRWRRQLARRLRERLGARDFSGLGWDLDYFFSRRDDRWYARIFEPGNGKRTGDVTPAYSRLDEDQVASIAGLLPTARIVFLMRDPIDRAWSSARMSSDRRGLDLADDGRWKSHFDNQKRLRGNYLRTLRLWREHYPEERFLVGFFEEILESPEELLLRVLDFLGARAQRELIPETARRRFNESSVVEMPAEVERYLAGMYLDDLRELEAMFGAPVRPWLARAERMADGAAAS
jgi:hypothetical protein